MIGHRSGFSSRVAVRAGAHLVALHLNLHIGIRLEIEIPGRRLRRSSLGSHDQIVLAVAAGDERQLPLLARLAPRRCQEQGLCSLPVVTLLSVGREVAIDVLLSEKRHLNCPFICREPGYSCRRSTGPYTPGTGTPCKHSEGRSN